jgi:putative endonuclease
MIKELNTGSKGEELATQYLLEKGFKIIERNWRYRHYEIDIIAIDRHELVIAEVRSRSEAMLVPAADTVNLKKQRFLIQAANAYIEKTNSNLEVRFDIITIVFSKNDFKIEHIPNAFYPLVK